MLKAFMAGIHVETVKSKNLFTVLKGKIGGFMVDEGFGDGLTALYGCPCSEHHY